MKRTLSMKTAALLLPLALFLPLAVAQPAAAVPARAVTATSEDTPGATPAPTATPSPTAIPSPTPEPTPTPTATPEPTPSPTPTPEPTPTPTPTPSPGLRVAPTPDADATALAVVPNAVRVAGADRYATSVAASQATFPTGARTVLIAQGTATIDGITAAGLAGALDAPLLYVQPSGVPSSVAGELLRLAPDRIVVLGGTAVIPDAVVRSLQAYAPSVTRMAGANRYGTSQAALAMLGTSFPTVYVAGGTALLDAPLAFATAAGTDRAALFVNGTTAAADAATIDTLRGVGAQRVVIVGGLGTVNKSYEDSLAAAGFAVERRMGADRYATAILMAGEQTVPAQRAIVANSSAMADIDVAAAIAGATGQPLLYVVEPCAPDSIAAYLASKGLPLTAVGGVAQVSPDTLAGRSCSVVKAQRESSLDAAIRSTVAKFTGSYWVTVEQLGGLNETVKLGGATPREPASMMKIFAAWAALTRIQQGRASPGTVLPSHVSLGTCLHIMIHVSDNYCHTDIVHWIGIAEINRMIHAAGFLNTSYGTVAPGVSVLYAGNRTTSNDLVRMMERLVHHTVLSQKWSDYLLNEMRNQIWRSRIASGIPPGVAQASKPGSLWIASGLMQADTAVVYGPKATYAISILGDNDPKAALQAISRTVYEHFHGKFGTAASYPVQQMYTRVAAQARSSAGGPVVLTIPPRTNIEVLDANRIWYLIRYGGRQLWVHYDTLRNR